MVSYSQFYVFQIVINHSIRVGKNRKNKEKEEEKIHTLSIKVPKMKVFFKALNFRTKVYFLHIL